LTT
jgi:hypothetical protein